MNPRIYIGADKFPVLHRACMKIAADNGAVNRVEGTPNEFRLRCSLFEAQVIERVLSTLSEEDLEILCCGEESEALEIAHRSVELRTAHDVLNRFFNDGMPFKRFSRRIS